MSESIILTSGLSDVDKSLVRHLFRLKASSLEYVEEVVGTYSTATKIIDTAEQVIDFMNQFSKKDSFFYVFMGDETEENLKLVCKTTDNVTEKTKYYAIKIHADWLDFSASQLTISGRMFTKIR